MASLSPSRRGNEPMCESDAVETVRALIEKDLTDGGVQREALAAPRRRWRATGAMDDLLRPYTREGVNSALQTLSSSTCIV